MVSKVVFVGLLLSVAVALCAGASLASEPKLRRSEPKLLLRSSEPKDAVLHRPKRFTFNGLVACLVNLGLKGPEAVGKNIKAKCGAADGSATRQACVTKEVLGLGPMFAKCVSQS